MPNGNGKQIAARVHGVTKTFWVGDAATKALKSVNLEVRLGELLMIVGPSGCGKTTLLSVLAGTLDVESGELEVLGTHLEEISERERTAFRAQNIGFIFQQFNLIPTLSCAENVSIPLLINKRPRRASEQRAAELLDQLGLEGRADHRPSLLSGGQQQRVAIARALVHEPRLIICDEPTSALDGDTGARIMELLQQVARNPNRAVIVVTHDNRIFRYADRIAEMEDGVIRNVHDNQENTAH